MSVTRRRIAQAALLGSASFLSLTFATEAQAQCVPTPAQPLNNITTDSTVISCTGSVNGPVITVNANGTNVDTNGPGTNVAGATITVTGNSNLVQVRSGAVLNGSQISLTGNGNTVLYGSGAISNGSIVTISGANSQLLFLAGSQVTQNPGQTFISALAGEQNNILIAAGGGLFTTGGNGQYLLTGGTGNQNVVIEGFLVAPSDGLAIALGDGDDSIAIGGSANISTQASGVALFDGGAGNDTFSLNLGGTWIHDTTGFEIININPNTAITLTGSNADAVQFNVQGGSVTVTSGAALGVATSTVDIGQFGNLTLAYSASASFDNTLTGSGGLNVDASGHTVTFGGNGSGYTGAVAITNGTTAVLGNANAIGSGAVTNDGTIVWADFNLANNIGGTGGLIYTGIGTGDLSGANSFSGGIDIQSGSLRVTNVGALGTGTITATNGVVILQLDNSTNQVLANNLTGALVLAKTSGGILDVIGTNTYTGGTLIDAGAIRVDDFARLGTGQVIANANGSLILNYNGAGQLLQTTAFLTGAGAFIKEGSGDVVIDVANTYTGGTTIRAGTLGLNDGLGLGTGSIQIDGGGVLGIGGVTLSNVVTGSGSIVKTASNQATLLGDNSGFVGLIDIQSGVISIGDGRSAGSGSANIGAGTALQINSTVGDTTIAANLGGAGNFDKLGASRVTLTGTNTLTGNVFVGDGTLQVAGSQNLGTAIVNLAGAGATLNLSTAGSTTLSNDVTGSGRVVKTGTGTVFITGANTYSGGTDIQQGAVRVTDVSFLGTGAITVQAGAALDLSIAGAQTLAQNVTGAGLLRKSGAGDLTLLSNGLTGGVDITSGRVIVNTANALGPGAVTIASGASLDYTAASNAVFANALSGAGTFNKLGTAQLTFGSNFSIGTLNALAGRTRINAVATANATVASGATLDGTGRIIGNLVNNGTVAPGNSIGTLTVQGNYTHNAGSVLEIEFDANGNIDRLDVTGNAVLNGGTIRFVSIGGAEGQGGTFLSTGGTVNGTFATIETVGAQLPLAVFYTANTAQMAPSVVTARPSTFNAQNLAAADTALGFIEALGLADARHGRGNRLWLSGFGAWGNRSASGATLAYDHDTRGISGGINLAVGGNVTLGAAVGWADGDITLGSNGGGGEQTHTLASLTARWQGASGLSLGAGALYGQVDQSTLRNVSFNGFGGSVEGATDSTIYGGFAEVGIPLAALQGWNIEATARASVIRQEQDGYTESGTSPLRLTLGDLATTTVEGQARFIGTKRLWDASGGQEVDAAGLDLRLDLGLRYLGLQGSREIPVIFAVSNAGIVLAGDTRDTLQGAGGIALDYTTSGGARLSLGYRGEFARTDRHTVQAGVSIAF